MIILILLFALLILAQLALICLDKALKAFLMIGACIATAFLRFAQCIGILTILFFTIALLIH